MFYMPSRPAMSKHPAAQNGFDNPAMDRSDGNGAADRVRNSDVSQTVGSLLPHRRLVDKVYLIFTAS